MGDGLFEALAKRGLGPLTALLVAALLLCSCRGGPDAPPAETGPCNKPELQDARRALLEAASLPVRRPPMPAIKRGPAMSGAGFQVQAVRWQHGAAAGDQVHGHLFTPDPVPEGDLPLLLNVHGHWGAGLEAREVSGRSQMFAREGWAVLSIALRGMEHGSTPVPDWRAAHYTAGLYGELRSRRGGKPPLSWDVVAAWGGLDAALAGRLGVPIRPGAVAVMGFSGGVERAVTLAASEPRIHAAVVGAMEYAFGTQQGQAMCSCGALPGGVEAAPLWLAQLGCRPGNPPQPRHALVWQAGETANARAMTRLRALPEVSLRSAEMHGVDDRQAAESLVFLEDRLLGKAADPLRSDALVAALQANYLQLDESLHMPLKGAALAPGRSEQGARPWKGAGPVQVAAAKALLGLANDGQPMARPLGLAPAEMKLKHARNLQSGHAWVVVVAGGPAGAAEAQWVSPSAGSDAVAESALIPDDAPMLFVRPAVAADAHSDQRSSRWGIDAPGSPLGLAIEDVLEARKRLREVRGVVPAKLGFVGVGAGAVPALWAAVIAGEGGPVALIDAPVSLWWDGPDAGEPVQPWPSWVLPAARSGASLDPWLAARSLGDRVRWLRPRDGSGEPWTAELIPGHRVERAEDLFTPETQ